VRDHVEGGVMGRGVVKRVIDLQRLEPDLQRSDFDLQRVIQRVM
jgi:hypothetical protein